MLITIKVIQENPNPQLQHGVLNIKQICVKDMSIHWIVSWFCQIHDTYLINETGWNNNLQYVQTLTFVLIKWENTDQNILIRASDAFKDLQSNQWPIPSGVLCINWPYLRKTDVFSAPHGTLGKQTFRSSVDGSDVIRSSHSRILIKYQYILRLNKSKYSLVGAKNTAKLRSSWRFRQRVKSMHICSGTHLQYK